MSNEKKENRKPKLTILWVLPPERVKLLSALKVEKITGDREINGEKLDGEKNQGSSA